MTRAARLRLGIASLALFAGAVPSFADALVWEQTSLVLEATSEDGQAKAVFPMRNPGKTPVSIQSVETSCHCASAKAIPQSLAPGEAGVVEVVLDLTGMSGRLRRTIRVNADDGAEPAMLGIQLNVTPVVGISPKLVWWNRDAAPAAQGVTLTLPFPEKTRILSVDTDSSAFEVELIAAAAGAPSREVRITPANTSAEEQARITVAFEYDGKRNKAYLLAAIK